MYIECMLNEGGQWMNDKNEWMNEWMNEYA